MKLANQCLAALLCLVLLAGCGNTAAGPGPSADPAAAGGAQLVDELNATLAGERDYYWLVVDKEESRGMKLYDDPFTGAPVYDTTYTLYTYMFGAEQKDASRNHGGLYNAVQIGDIVHEVHEDWMPTQVLGIDSSSEPDRQTGWVTLYYNVQFYAVDPATHTDTGLLYTGRGGHTLSDEEVEATLPLLPRGEEYLRYREDPAAYLLGIGISPEVQTDMGLLQLGYGEFYWNEAIYDYREMAEVYGYNVYEEEGERVHGSLYNPLLTVPAEVDIMTGDSVRGVYGTVGADGGLNLRGDPRADGHKVLLIPKGERIIVIGRSTTDPAWLYVEYYGSAGYVLGEHVILD